jgi:hypothetical protein
MKYGVNIIELLKEEGIEINKQLANTIQMLAYENFETVKEKGIKEGIKIGIRKACKEFEVTISTIRNEIED